MGFYSTDIYKSDLEEISDNIVNCELLKNKNILVTGANGLIASYIVDTFLWLNENRDFNIHIYALARSRSKIESRFEEHLNNQNFHIILQSVTEPITSINYRFDYVIHAACSAHPLAYSTAPVEIIKSNIVGTENLLNYMISHDGGKLLFVSSSEVYGENKNIEKIGEDDYGYINIINPRSCYSESKRAAETLCASYAKEYGIESCYVRPGFIFGAAITDDNSRADAQFLRNVIKGEDIVMKSPGLQLRSYEYVSDAVSAILTVLINGENMNAYNIASSISSATIREFAELIASEGGTRVIFENPDEVEKAGYSVISRCILDSQKIESLGWKPSVTIREGVKRMLNITKEIGSMEKIPDK